MPNLPAKANFTGASVTEGGFRTNFDDMIDYLNSVIGGTDSSVQVFSGTDASRPATTAGGWLRYNSTNHVMDVSIGATAAWNKLVHSSIDATWKWFLEVGQTSGLMISNASGTDCKIGVDSTGGFVELGVDTDEAYINSEGTRPFRIQIGGTPVFKMTSAGDLTVTNNLIGNGSVTISDKRLKKNIKPIDNALNVVRKLNGYTFTKKRNSEDSAGVIAQEVLNAFPDAVKTFRADDKRDYLAVDYNALIGPLIESIKELDQKVKELEALNNDNSK